jgi:hypothetical protein
VAGVELGRLGVTAGDDGGGVALQLGGVFAVERSRGRDDEGLEAEGRGAVEGDKVGAGGVLDGQAAVQQFVGLEVGAGGMGVGVVVLGEEAAGAQDHDRQALFGRLDAAQAFRGEFGDAVDVAWGQGARRLVEPDGGLAGLVADGLGDHQGGGGGEDEAVGPGRAGRPQQVQRAGDIDVDEGLGIEADDIGLVQGAAVDDGVDGVLGEGPLDQGAVGDAAQNDRVGAGGDVEADDPVALRPQQGGEVAAEPAGGACEEDAHGRF